MSQGFHGRPVGLGSGGRRASKQMRGSVESRGLIMMRILVIWTLVITETVALGGCFHHQKAVTQEPLKLG